MKKCISIILLIALMLMLTGVVTAVELNKNVGEITHTSSGEEKVYCEANLQDEFAGNRVMVVLSNEASLDFNTYEVADFSEIDCAAVNDLSVASGRRIQKKVEAVTAAVMARSADLDMLDTSGIDTYNQVLCIELEENSKQKVLDTIDELMERDDVIYAGPDYVIQMCSDTPNDADYLSQTASSVINLPQAWSVTTGSSDVLVGVIDSGIDSRHVDLDANVNGALSMDFSTGGYISEPYPTDSGNHGTHVAGIIGAEGDNGNGIAGVCWQVSLVSLKVFQNGVGYSSYVSMAINYAESNDIPILNFSGGYYSGNGNMKYYDESLYQAIESYSGLFVCAAGNNDTNTDINTYYPACLTLNNIISVGNSTDADQLGENTNYGSNSVDLFAPGENVYSTIPGQDYSSKSGTSMSAPYVTGVAALILSVYPGLLPCEIKDSILSNVEDCGTAFDNQCVSKGRLDAYKAVTNVQRHTMISTDAGLDDMHTVTCSSCGCSGVREHDYDNISFKNYLQHTISCDCGRSYDESHTWNATKTKCRVCGYDISGPVVVHVLKFKEEKGSLYTCHTEYSGKKGVGV